jgi:hypothetical protein
MPQNTILEGFSNSISINCIHARTKIKVVTCEAEVLNKFQKNILKNAHVTWHQWSY